MNPAENYILNQPEPYRSIILHLQILIEAKVPEVELLYKYKIPFYYLNKKPFMYINASHKRQYVDLGICKGKQLQIHTNSLVYGDRKKMASLRYTRIEDIDEKEILGVLTETASLY